MGEELLNSSTKSSRDMKRGEGRGQNKVQAGKSGFHPEKAQDQQQ